MAINTHLPGWLQEANTSWLRAGERSGAHAISQGFEAGIRVRQQQQQDALRLKQLILQEQQMTQMNELRFQQLEEAQLEVDDVPLLNEFAKTGELSGNLRSPKSFQKLSSIELARTRSEAGRQLAADQADFNKRLLKVSAEARALIRDMQRQGSPEAEVWGALGAAERTEQDRLLASKREMTDYQKAQVDLRERKMEMDIEKFDAQHAATLKKLGFTEERLALDRERLKSGKAFAPTEIKKLYDEATEWDLKGMHEEAEVSRQRARTLASPGSNTGTLSKRVRAQALADQYRLGEIDKAAYDAALDKLFPEVAPVLRFDPSTNSVAPIK